MTSPYQSEPYQRGSALSRSFLPLALIALGVIFLLGNVLPERGRGGLILAGLGGAFFIGRVTTGRYGYAVPAGLLIALGAYVGLQEVRILQPTRGPGLFFVLFGLGFALVYLMGSRPHAVWPLFPGAIFLCLGLLVFGVTSLAALAAFGWIVSYWPAVLVVVGAWLLFRDQLPPAAQRPIATLGGLALLAYGLLAAAATMATGGALVRTGFAPSFGASPFADTVTLTAPIADGQTFTVNNPSGRTTIQASSRTDVHVVATRRYSLGGDIPEVRLNPGASGVNLEAAKSGRAFPFSTWESVDYAIEVPALTVVKAQSGSGEVEIDGVNGSVQADTGSGRLKLTNLAGSVQARSSSGSVELNNIAADVRVTTSSGRIRGTELRHVREATASSGAILLEAVFIEEARIRASSGHVNVTLLPGSAVQLNVRTSSGNITQNRDLPPSGGRRGEPHALTATIGNPAPGATLSIETSSGSIHINQ